MNSTISPKTCVLIAFVLLGAACAQVPLEELEAEALATGDWSKVEKREQSIERRRLQKLPSGCGPKGVLLCRGSGILNRSCECTGRRSARVNL